jgi:hypothetical protein
MTMTKSDFRDWTAAILMSLMGAIVVVVFTAKMFGVNL